MLRESSLPGRVALALLVANVRYWRVVAPQVRRELRRWSRRAAMIPDPHLRELAVEKLRTEHFNAEVAATLATVVPSVHRRQAVEAIVAFEVLYDYLDGLTEEPADDRPLASRWELYSAFTATFDPSSRRRRAADSDSHGRDDGGYMRELSATVRTAIASLPGTPVVARTGARAAERCAAGQIRVHAIPQVGASELERWAKDAGACSGLRWQEYTAGAVASVLAVHALIVASTQTSVTEEEAEAVDAAYLSISAISTMLDSMVDYERDVAAGDPWLVQLYGGDVDLLADRLVEVAEGATLRAQQLAHGAHHVMTLMGVVAYYTSAQEARSELARPAIGRLHRALGPSVLPTLAVMRSWRLAKKARALIRGTKPPQGTR